jgi:uncharacterized protein YcbK (DUF882 family)
MRAIILLAISALVFPHTAQALDLKKKTFTAFVSQTPRVQMDCFPRDLQIVLRDLADKFGKPVIVTSGHRNNRATLKGSRHRTCTAADIKIPGVRPSELAKAARELPITGGVGTYCGRSASIVHVDVGPVRNWRYYCGGKKKRNRS